MKSHDTHYFEVTLNDGYSLHILPLLILLPAVQKAVLVRIIYAYVM